MIADPPEDPGTDSAVSPERDPHALATNSPETDPERWGHSLSNAIELVTRCLDIAGVRSVGEIGAYAGDLTVELLEWAAEAGSKVIAVDPTPAPPLIRLAADRPDLELIREPSHAALAKMDLPDALIIDGDHNHYTVSEELRIIGERSGGDGLPLLVFHDVCWPHARRDSYYAPERIPAAHRQPLVEGAGLFPGEPGVMPGGLPYPWAAEREGGKKNGVTTAIEDFIADRSGLRFAVVPVFFGVGFLWEKDRTWSDQLEAVVGPFDRNPVLERMEANRVFHLAREGLVRGRLAVRRQRSDEIELLLRDLLASSAFRTADRIAQLRQGKSATSWREQIENLLREID